jgi:methyl-accepting chemotaxis protein
MKVIFGPGLRAIGLFGPLGRALLIVFVFALALAAALGFREATWGSGTAVALGILGAYLVFALVLWGQIGMARISRTVERIALGDLSMHSGSRASEGSDADRMWGSITLMNQSLAEIVKQVNASSEAIRTAAHEIADGYSNLSQRTETQASTLEETASGTEELSATVKQNAENCRRADELANHASEIAANAAQTMRTATITMHRIEASSKRVAEVTGVIEGIAFQTNILALNAAVEAARAGEQGRGFAVVAAEVRSLAQRSAEAAKEIKALIAESVATVSEGARQVETATATISDAATSVVSVSSVIGDIARASAEQSTGVEEIGKAIQQLESVTQQNAALVEQAGAAALSFEEEATRLIDAVGAFKLDRTEARDRAIDLAKKGIAHLAAVGEKRAFADFERKGGEFYQGDHYLWVADLEGIVRCHAASPKSRNTSFADLKDNNGKFFIREVLRIARERGKGWVDYQWYNPVSKQVEPKSTYFERTGNLIFFCGIYRTESTSQARTTMPAQRRLAAAAS